SCRSAAWPWGTARGWGRAWEWVGRVERAPCTRRGTRKTSRPSWWKRTWSLSSAEVDLLPFELQVFFGLHDRAFAEELVGVLRDGADAARLGLRQLFDLLVGVLEA